MVEVLIENNEERQFIQGVYCDLFWFIKLDVYEEDCVNIWVVYELVVQAYVVQWCKLGEFYILYFIVVVKICVDEIGFGLIVIICVFLYDVVEDMEVILEDIWE